MSYFKLYQEGILAKKIARLKAMPAPAAFAPECGAKGWRKRANAALGSMCIFPGTVPILAKNLPWWDAGDPAPSFSPIAACIVFFVKTLILAAVTEAAASV